MRVFTERGKMKRLFVYFLLCLFMLCAGLYVCAERLNRQLGVEAASVCQVCFSKGNVEVCALNDSFSFDVGKARDKIRGSSRMEDALDLCSKLSLKARKIKNRAFVFFSSAGRQVRGKKDSFHEDASEKECISK